MKKCFQFCTKHITKRECDMKEMKDERWIEPGTYSYIQKNEQKSNKTEKWHPNETLIRPCDSAKFCRNCMIYHHVYYVDSSTERILKHDRVQSARQHTCSCIWLTNEMNWKEMKLVQRIEQWNTTNHGGWAESVWWQRIPMGQRDWFGLVKRNKIHTHQCAHT